MRGFKQQFYMRWDEILLVFGMTAGFFLFGEILLAIIVHFNGKEESLFPIGTVLALCAPLFVMMFLGISTLPLYFNLSVSLGAARRRVVPMILGISFLEIATAIGEAYLFYHLEQWIFLAAYPGMESEVDLRFIFRWNYILLACLAVVAINAFMGALFLKFGQKALTIFWIIWMVASIGIPRIISIVRHAKGKGGLLLDICRKIGEIFLGFTENGILAAVLLLSIVFLFVSWMMLRKQQVAV